MSDFTAGEIVGALAVAFGALGEHLRRTRAMSDRGTLWFLIGSALVIFITSLIVGRKP